MQCDTQAARTLADRVDLTLVTLPAAMKATLRGVDLARLAESGPLGASLARQSAAHAEDHEMSSLGRGHPGLPDDLINFHWDPVACAVALGWEGATVLDVRLQPVLNADVLRFQPGETGRALRVVTNVDGEAFTDTWLTAVEAAQQRPR